MHEWYIFGYPIPIKVHFQESDLIRAAKVISLRGGKEEPHPPRDEVLGPRRAIFLTHPYPTTLDEKINRVLKLLFFLAQRPPGSWAERPKQC